MPRDILRSRYRAHKGNAKKRGVVFELTFDEWVKIWIDSGRLQERGQRKGGYVMARFGDKGPYKIGNVKIIKAEENGREYMRRVKSKLLEINLGNGYAKGLRHTDETKALISTFHQGNSWHRGMKMSTSARMQISSSLKRYYLRNQQSNQILTREQQNAVLMDYSAGMKVSEIAAKYGVGAAYAPNLARRRGLPIRRPFKKERVRA